ncbi:MAG: hypothetical protein M3O55_07430 [Actinomycetota bacterium]|nr:hypothetical protein [Actinomycetota bacterium]
MNTPTPEVVKWYTRARKFPQLIGRTPDGAKIWGGPYTFTQAIGGGLVLLVGVNTMGLWANYGLIGNAILLLGVTYGIVMLLGRIPVGSRSPLSVITGTLQAVFSPHAGRLAGRPVRLRRPHRVRHRITVLLDQPAPPLPGRLPRVLPTERPAAAAPKPAPAAKPEPTPAPRRPVALSGIQSLLAQARTRPPVQED